MEQQFNEIADALKDETERAESAIRMVPKTCSTCLYGHGKIDMERCKHGSFWLDGTECNAWKLYVAKKEELI